MLPGSLLARKLRLIPCVYRLSSGTATSLLHFLCCKLQDLRVLSAVLTLSCIASGTSPRRNLGTPQLRNESNQVLGNVSKKI